MAYKLTEAERKHVSTVEDTALYLEKEFDQASGTTQKVSIVLKDDTPNGLDLKVDLPTHHFEVDKSDDTVSRIRFVDSDGNTIYCNGMEGMSGNPVGLGWRYKVCFTYEEGTNYINGMKVIRRNDGREWDHPIGGFTDLQIKSVVVDNDSTFNSNVSIKGDTDAVNADFKHISLTDDSGEEPVITDITASGVATPKIEAEEAVLVTVESDGIEAKELSVEAHAYIYDIEAESIVTKDLNVTTKAVITDAEVAKAKIDEIDNSEGSANLGITEAAKLVVNGTASVSEDLYVAQSAYVDGDLDVDGKLNVDQTAKFGGNVESQGTIFGQGGLNIAGNTVLQDAVYAEKNVDIAEGLKVGADIEASGITVKGDAVVDGNLEVGGSVSFDDFKANSIEASSVSVADKIESSKAAFDSVESDAGVFSNLSAVDFDVTGELTVDTLKTNNIESVTGDTYISNIEDKVTIGNPVSETTIISSTGLDSSDDNYGHLKVVVDGHETTLANKEDIDALNTNGLVDRYTNQTVSGVKKFTNIVAAQAGVGFIDQDGLAQNMLVHGDVVMENNAEYEKAKALTDAYDAAIDSYSEMWNAHAHAQHTAEGLENALKMIAENEGTVGDEDNPENATLLAKKASLQEELDAIEEQKAQLDTEIVTVGEQKEAKYNELAQIVYSGNTNAINAQNELSAAARALEASKYTVNISDFEARIKASLRDPANNIPGFVQILGNNMVDQKNAKYSVDALGNVKVDSCAALMDEIITESEELRDLSGLTEAGRKAINDFIEEAKSFRADDGKASDSLVAEYKAAVARYEAAQRIADETSSGLTIDSILPTCEEELEKANAKVEKEEQFFTDLETYNGLVETFTNAYDEAVRLKAEDQNDYREAELALTAARLEYEEFVAEHDDPRFQSEATGYTKATFENSFRTNAAFSHVIINDVDNDEALLNTYKADQALYKTAVEYKELVESYDSLSTEIDAAQLSINSYSNAIAEIDEQIETLRLNNNEAEKYISLNSARFDRELAEYKAKADSYIELLNEYNRLAAKPETSEVELTVPEALEEKIAFLKEGDIYRAVYPSPVSTELVVKYKEGMPDQYVVGFNSDLILGNPTDHLKMETAGIETDKTNPDGTPFVNIHIPVNVTYDGEGQYKELAYTDDIAYKDTEVKDAEAEEGTAVKIDVITAAQDEHGFPVKNELATFTSESLDVKKGEGDKEVNLEINEEWKTKIQDAKDNADDALELARSFEDRVGTLEKHKIEKDDGITVSKEGNVTTIGADFMVTEKSTAAIEEAYDPEGHTSLNDDSTPFEKVASAADVMYLNDSTNKRVDDFEHKFETYLPDVPKTTGRYNLVANIVGGDSGRTEMISWSNDMRNLPECDIEKNPQGAIDVNFNPLNPTLTYGLKLQYNWDNEAHKWVPLIGWEVLVGEDSDLEKDAHGWTPPTLTNTTVVEDTGDEDKDDTQYFPGEYENGEVNGGESESE